MTNLSVPSVKHKPADQRTHSFFMMDTKTWKKWILLLDQKEKEHPKQHLFEHFKPMPQELVADVDNSEYIEKENRDIGDVAVVVVDEVLHDTKRNIWIAKNWGCDKPLLIQQLEPGTDVTLENLLPTTIKEEYLNKIGEEFEIAYKRLKTNDDIGYVHVVSNAAPVRFFEHLAADHLEAKIEFISIDAIELQKPNSNFYDVVKRGCVSDWGTSYYKKPLSFEKEDISSLFIKSFCILALGYLSYSYFLGT